MVVMLGVQVQELTSLTTLDVQVGDCVFCLCFVFGCMLVCVCVCVCECVYLCMYTHTFTLHPEQRTRIIPPRHWPNVSSNIPNIMTLNP